MVSLEIRKAAMNNFRKPCQGLFILAILCSLLVSTSFIMPGKTDITPQVDTYFLSVSVLPAAGDGTVTLSSNGPYHLGDIVVLTESPASGWSFGSWSGDGTGIGATRSVTITGNMSVTATFVQNSYSIAVAVLPSSGAGSVTFSSNGPYHLGDSVILTESPASGWGFSGWSGDGTGSGATRSVTVTGNMSVTATFVQNSYSIAVSVIPNAGAGTVTFSSNGPYHLGDVVILTETPSSGWSFSGWTDDGTGSGTTRSVTVTGNMAVTAIFAQNFYSISSLVYPSASAGTVSASAAGPYHYGDVVVFTETPSSGWSFNGWSGDGTGTGTTRSVTVTGSMAITANFVQNPYTLTANIVGSGSVSKSPDQASYHLNDNVILTATPIAGWSFSGWSGNLTGTGNPAAVSITGNIVVTATFVRSAFSVSLLVFPSSSAGSVTANATGPYHYGDVVVLTETPVSGWSFSGWSGDGAGSGVTRSVTVTGNMAVTANFAQNPYGLSINIVGSGSVAKNPNQTTYHFGDLVNLTATPASGWSFSGWSSGVTSLVNPVTVNITKDTSITATFTQITYQVTFGTTGSGTINPSGAQTYIAGQVVSITANVGNGYVFSYWSATPPESATFANVNSTSTTVTINGNCTVSASFTLIPPTPSPTPIPTDNPLQTPAPTPNSTPIQSPSPTSQPSATPIPNAITIEVTALNGSKVNLTAKGDITSSNVNSATLTTDGSSTTTVSLMVVGQSVTSGLGNVTIPKSIIPNGGTPSIYINSLLASNQGYSQDAKNYYLWYATNSKTYELSIAFKVASSSNGFPLWIFLVLIPVIVVVAVFVFARKRVFKVFKPRTEKGDDYSDYV
jgi:ribosomal protein S28E/S33